MAEFVDTDALVEGSNRIAQVRQDERTHIRMVRGVATEIIVAAGSEGIPEADAIQRVMKQARTDQDTAAAAVDRVKSLGKSTKNMQTGVLTPTAVSA